MPKYTQVTAYSAGDTITSSDWNQYFGSKGNVQWAYDEYANISALDGATLLNSAYVTTSAAYEVARFINYNSYRGSNDNFSIMSGSIMPPVYAGYAWISVTVEHQVVSASYLNAPSFYILIYPLSDTLNGITSATDTIYKMGVSTNNAQSSSTITSWGLWPVIKTATYSTIVQIRDGFTKFQAGIYRTDAAILAADKFRCTEFTVLPLGDVSGFVNVLEQLTVVE